MADPGICEGGAGVAFMDILIVGHAWKYILISTSHDAYKLSFLPRTIIAWNQLPSIMIMIIITAPSLEAFRSRLITSQP